MIRLRQVLPRIRPPGDAMIIRDRDSPSGMNLAENLFLSVLSSRAVLKFRLVVLWVGVLLPWVFVVGMTSSASSPRRSMPLSGGLPTLRDDKNERPLALRRGSLFRVRRC
jgi:hypothetical protein